HVKESFEAGRDPGASGFDADAGLRNHRRGKVTLRREENGLGKRPGFERGHRKSFAEGGKDKGVGMIIGSGFGFADRRSQKMNAAMKAAATDDFFQLSFVAELVPADNGELPISRCSWA